MSRVDIGFLEETDSSLLKSHFFPSKVGGKPSWLALKDLPTSEELECETCTKPLVFLTQIYAPFEEDPNNFHRTLFIFVCRNSECCKSNVNMNIRVFRSQLQRENEFYSSVPPSDDTEFDVEKFVRLCTVCGCAALKHCSKCKDTYYCSREHQVVDWKSGHKTYCQNRDIKPSINILFNEFEMIIEEEDIQTEIKDEQKRMEEFEQLSKEGKMGTLSEISEDELQEHASMDKDKIFLHFRKRIQNNPDQVLRYQRGGEPLWVAENPKPVNIPLCEHCGCERQFEFQILPQLLFELKEEKLDWGTLIIYSCKNSCIAGLYYKKEYIFKQDVAN